jgi:hypothetical protein
MTFFTLSYPVNVALQDATPLPVTLGGSDLNIVALEVKTKTGKSGEFIYPSAREYLALGVLYL